MNGEQIRRLVESQIDDEWNTTNGHGVDLRKALLPPRQIAVIERLVRDGKITDRLVDVWLVLLEDPEEETGYRIVAAMDGCMFGLASDGFPSDDHLVLCGWYGDFMATYQGM